MENTLEMKCAVSAIDKLYSSNPVLTPFTVERLSTRQASKFGLSYLRQTWHQRCGQGVELCLRGEAMCGTV